MHNMKELPYSKRLAFLQGRAQPKGKRATTNAFGSHDYSARASSDVGLLGSDRLRTYHAGVDMFSFWYVAPRRGVQSVTA